MRTTWSRPRPRPEVFEAKAKAKATKFCPRGVLEVEASPRGPHPCIPEYPANAQYYAILGIYVKKLFKTVQFIKDYVRVTCG